MNKHKPHCWMSGAFHPPSDGPCTCDLDDPPPVTLRYAPLERDVGRTVSVTMPIPHKADCAKILCADDGPCTCGLDDPPPVTMHTVASIDVPATLDPPPVTMKMLGESDPPPCPYCHGTGRLTMPEPIVEANPIYESHAT